MKHNVIITYIFFSISVAGNHVVWLVEVPAVVAVKGWGCIGW